MKVEDLKEDSPLNFSDLFHVYITFWDTVVVYMYVYLKHETFYNCI